jgi:NTP pyrophosphatase (non-canonical NTP hydrolase)
MNDIDDEDMTYEPVITTRTLDAYQADAMRTRNGDTDLLYAAGKLTAESGELLQHVLKARYHGRTAPSGAMLEELGDVLWYVAAVATDLGLSLSDVAESNLAKLRARHGGSYNPAHYRDREAQTN